jgi:hypothetical protein
MKRTLVLAGLVLLTAAAAVAEEAAPVTDRPAARARRPRVRLKDVLEKLPDLLGLSEQQQQKAAPLLEQFAKDHKTLMGSIRDRLVSSRKIFQAAVKAAREDPSEENKKAVADARRDMAAANKPVRELLGKLLADLKAILTAEQMAKLNRALNRRPAARRAAARVRPIPIWAVLRMEGISDEQKTKLQQLDKELQDLLAQHNQKVMAVLTDAQKARLKDLRARPLRRAPRPAKPEPPAEAPAE